MTGSIADLLLIWRLMAAVTCVFDWRWIFLTCVFLERCDHDSQYRRADARFDFRLIFPCREWRLPMCDHASRIARQGASMESKLSASQTIECGGNWDDLDAELIGFMRLALANTFNLWSMEGVNLFALLAWSLLQDCIGLIKRPSKSLAALFVTTQVGVQYRAQCIQVMSAICATPFWHAWTVWHGHNVDAEWVRPLTHAHSSDATISHAS